MLKSFVETNNDETTTSGGQTEPMGNDVQIREIFQTDAHVLSYLGHQQVYF